MSEVFGRNHAAGSVFVENAVAVVIVTLDDQSILAEGNMLFLEEEDLSISIIVDSSASMNVGNPTKFLYAKRVAAALAYIGLRAQDRVSVFFANERISDALTGLRGKMSAHRIFEFLTIKESDGQTNLAKSCKEFVLKYPRKGVVFLISDFLDRSGFEEALKSLFQLQSDVGVIHLLSDEEAEPVLEEDYKLIDFEDGRTIEVSRSDIVMKMYLQ